ncbi:MAG: acyltransferase [Bacteroidetes bacterium]|nr:acyltransferase [Bacteroidota bacterium]
MVTKEIQNKEYYIQLDGLRFFAILSVLICHWISYSAIGLLPFGSFGVNLFFVLSGYLITNILLLSRSENELHQRKHWISLKQFYIRRILRIFPIYYLLIFLVIILNLLPTKEISWWLLTYGINYYIAIPHINYGNFGHLWSLGVEEQFYIFYPFLIFFLPKKYIYKSLWILIIAGILSRLILYLSGAYYNSLYSWLPCCLDAFGMGALMAYLSIYDKAKLINILAKNKFWFLCLFGFAIITIIARYLGAFEGRTILERTFSSAICFWIIGLSITGAYKGRFKELLENSKIVFLGRISYSLYLFHNFVPNLLSGLCNYFHIIIPYKNHSVLVLTPF